MGSPPAWPPASISSWCATCSHRRRCRQHRYRFFAGAFFAGAFLAGAFFAGAFLAGAFLAGAFLAGAFLAGAFLAGAFFAGAFLAGAFLAGAFLAGAFLAGAFFAGALALLEADDFLAAEAVRLTALIGAAFPSSTAIWWPWWVWLSFVGGVDPSASCGHHRLRPRCRSRLTWSSTTSHLQDRAVAYLI